MSRISIDGQGVTSVINDLNRTSLTASNVRQGIATTGYQVDPSIAARRNLRQRINRAEDRMIEVESNIRELKLFLQTGVDRYEQTESQLKNKADSIGKHKSFDLWGLLTGAFHSFESWLQSENGKRLLELLHNIQPPPLQQQMNDLIDRYNKGVTADDIRAMQELLRKMNIYDGPVTGSYNQDFLYAVFFYQNIVDTYYHDKVDVDGKITEGLIRRAIIDAGLGRKVTWIDPDAPAGTKTISAVAQGFSLDMGESASDYSALMPWDPYFYKETLPGLVQFSKMIVNGDFREIGNALKGEYIEPYKIVEKLASKVMSGKATYEEAQIFGYNLAKVMEGVIAIGTEVAAAAQAAKTLAKLFPKLWEEKTKGTDGKGTPIEREEEGIQRNEEEERQRREEQERQRREEEETAGKGNLIQEMLDSPSSEKWGVLEDGTNQGVKHFADYWEKYPDRIPSLAKRLGVDESKFENSVEGFENFTAQAERVIEQGQVREVNGKQIYYLEGAENPKKGVVVIVKDEKIQSIMPSDPKSFEKLQ